MASTFSTCDLCDAHEGLLASGQSGQLRVLPPIFRSFGAIQRFEGPIVTLKTYEDNSLVKAELDTPGQGRVLLVDGGGSTMRALLGGNIASAAAKNGWAGVIVWGAVRDVAELSAALVGIFAIAPCPARSFKRGQGARNVAVQIAGVPVSPGEYLYADADGVIIHPQRL